MLTNNYYSYMMMRSTKKEIPNALVAYDGTKHSAYPYSGIAAEKLFDVIYILGKAANGVGATIGSGTTPATPGDYKLESIITDGFSAVNQTAATLNVDDDGVSVFATYAITNTGTDDLVISEIGLTGALNNTDNNVTCRAMIDRTVLETPITIPVGQSKQITYTIRLNYPTA